MSLVSVFCCLTAPCKITRIPALGLYDVRCPGSNWGSCSTLHSSCEGPPRSLLPPGLLHVVAGCPYPALCLTTAGLPSLGPLGRGHDCPSAWGSAWRAQFRLKTGRKEDGETHRRGEDRHLCDPVIPPGALFTVEGSHWLGQGLFIRAGPRTEGKGAEEDDPRKQVRFSLSGRAASDEDKLVLTHICCLWGWTQSWGSPGPWSLRSGSIPVIAVQSGPRLGGLCLRTPCLASSYGEEGCTAARPGPQAVPFSFTSTTAMLSGNLLS